MLVSRTFSKHVTHKKTCSGTYTSISQNYLHNYQLFSEEKESNCFYCILIQCNPQEFYSVCKALEAVYESFKMHREAVNESKASDKLKGLVSEIPELLCDIEDFSKALSEKEARYLYMLL